jgi:hypothetical protein
MDTCDLLLNTLTVLANEFSASTDGIPSAQQWPGDTPSISNNKQACEEQQAEDKNFKRHVPDSFGHIALAEGHLALGSALEKKMEAYVLVDHFTSSCYFVADLVFYSSTRPETFHVLLCCVYVGLAVLTGSQFLLFACIVVIILMLRCLIAGVWGVIRRT